MIVGLLHILLLLGCLLLVVRLLPLCVVALLHWRLHWWLRWRLHRLWWDLGLLRVLVRLQEVLEGLQVHDLVLESLEDFLNRWGMGVRRCLRSSGGLRAAQSLAF